MKRNRTEVINIDDDSEDVIEMNNEQAFVISSDEEVQSNAKRPRKKRKTLPKQEPVVNEILDDVLLPPTPQKKPTEVPKSVPIITQPVKQITASPPATTSSNANEVCRFCKCAIPTTKRRIKG